MCWLSDGTPCRSHLYAADLATWLWTILLQGAPLRPYNVGSDEEVTIADLSNVVADCFQPRPQVQIAHQATLSDLPERYVPSIQRAATELNLKPRICLQAAVESTVSWFSTAAQVSQ